MKAMKALLHAHSRYSYDGVRTVGELAEWGASRGLDFVFLTEHTNDFDDAKMKRLVAECDACSDRACRVIPGLEFSVQGGFHLLGLNVRRFTPLIELASAARFIREQGGIAILAHPARYGARWPQEEAIAQLDGIEAWNARYDGRFLPPGRLVEHGLRQKCASGAGLLFGGQDLHDTTHHRVVITTVGGEGGLDAFLFALRSGDSRFGAGPFSIASRTGMHPVLRRTFGAFHAAYRIARKTKKKLQTGTQALN